MPEDAPFLHGSRPAPLVDALGGPPRPTVLAVDDTPANLSLLSQLLGRHFRVQLALSGAKALEIARRRAPDLVLLDVMMPDMDGYEVCRHLKADAHTAGVPVIFLTALDSEADETRAFEAGGADFVSKPFNPATLLARVRTHLDVKAWHDAMADRNAWLTRELEIRAREVDRLRDTTLYMMVSLAEFRDEDTGHHVHRTEEYTRVLATWWFQQGLAPMGMDGSDLEAIAKAAPLHDIGKVAIPDRILLKPGPLTAEEWVVMRQHTVHGARLLERAILRLGEEAGPLLRYAMQIARHHHERWDGSGYPDGLAGEAIPLPARLLAMADVYDALINRRPYKAALSHAAALAVIEAESGSHFDPRLVRALREVQPDLVAIAERLKD